MGPDKKATGYRGEEIAARYLKKHGYRILQRNYSCPLGEIDLVASKRGTLVFVEVKTRTESGFGPPELSVGHRKRRRISSIALDYARRKGIKECNARFDVITVLLPPDSEPVIELFEDAFPLTGV